MLKFLQSFFRIGDPLVKAGRRLRGEAFARAIGRANVFVLAAMQSEGLDPATTTQAELLAEIERAAYDLSDPQKSSDIFIYQRDGVSCLPFFSSQKHCETFCGEYSKLRNRIYPFQVLGVKGSVLATSGSVVERLILNAGTSDERPLSTDEMRLFEAIWA